MPKVTAKDIEALKKAGWVEHYSGLPADLYFSKLDAKEPWSDKPHLHLNYATNGELQSLTWKSEQSTTTYLFQNGEWLDFGVMPEGLKEQAEWLKSNLK